MPTDIKPSRGLQFFHPSATRTYRRNRIVFVIVMAVICLAINWPIYPLFSGIYPLILGFPLSFAWIIVCLLISMAALILLYRWDITHINDEEA